MEVRQRGESWEGELKEALKERKEDDRKLPREVPYEEKIVHEGFYSLKTPSLVLGLSATSRPTGIKRCLFRLSGIEDHLGLYATFLTR